MGRLVYFLNQTQGVVALAALPFSICTQKIIKHRAMPVQTFDRPVRNDLPVGTHAQAVPSRCKGGPLICGCIGPGAGSCGDGG